MLNETEKQDSTCRHGSRMLQGCPSRCGEGWLSCQLPMDICLVCCFHSWERICTALNQSNNVSGLFMQGVRYSHLDGDSGQDVGALEAALILDTIQKGLWTRRGPKLCPNQQWGKYRLRA